MTSALQAARPPGRFVVEPSGIAMATCQDRTVGLPAATLAEEKLKAVQRKLEDEGIIPIERILDEIPRFVTALDAARADTEDWRELARLEAMAADSDGVATEAEIALAESQERILALAETMRTMMQNADSSHRAFLEVEKAAAMGIVEG